MNEFHDECVKELCLELCDIFGKSTTALIREARTKITIELKLPQEEIPEALGVPYPALLILAAEYGSSKYSAWRNPIIA